MAVGLHPGLFTFLNRLRTGVFEESVNVVLQTDNARMEKTNQTRAIQRLKDLAEQSEQEYENEIIKAEDLLRRVAAHYDDDKVIEALSAADELADLAPGAVAGPSGAVAGPSGAVAGPSGAAAGPVAGPSTSQASRYSQASQGTNASQSLREYFILPLLL